MLFTCNDEVNLADPSRIQNPAELLAKRLVTSQTLYKTNLNNYSNRGGGTISYRSRTSYRHEVEGEDIGSGLNPLPSVRICFCVC